MAITTSLMMFGVAGVIGSFLFARALPWASAGAIGKSRVSLAGVALALAL